MANSSSSSSGASATRHRRGVRYLGAFGLFVLVVGVTFHGVLEHPGSRIPFGISDATGTLRVERAIAEQHRNPFTFHHDALAGAPEGLDLPPAAIGGSVVQTGFTWELRGPLGSVGAWNAFIVLGFLATATAMFVFLDRLGCVLPASLFGAYVFAFSPFAYERAYAGHIAYVQNWMFVLLAAALLLMRERRSVASAFVVGAAIALVDYTAAYFVLLAGIVLGVFTLVELARMPAERARTAALSAASLVFAAVLLAPILVTYARERRIFSAATTHAGSDFYRFAASPRSYLVPSPRNPLFHWVRGFHPVLLTEETLFFGYTTLALAIAGFVLLRRRDSWFWASESRRWTATLFASLVPAAFLLSLPPSYQIGKVEVPTPSLALALFTSFFRDYARIGLIAGFGLAVLASFALTALARRGRTAWRFAASAALAVVVLVELLPGNAGAFDTTKRPPWVDWLRSQPKGIVATYPAPIRPEAQELNRLDYWYQTFDRQPRFQLPDLNILEATGRNNNIRLLARALTAPVTARILATEGVRYVVVHDDVYRAEGRRPPRLDPRRFRLLARFGAVRIYSVHATHVDLDTELRRRRAELRALEGLPPLPRGR